MSTPYYRTIEQFNARESTMDIETHEGFKIAFEQCWDNSWSVYLPDEYDGAEDAGPQMVGTGRTREDALDELLEMLGERQDEREAAGEWEDDMFEREERRYWAQHGE